MKIKVINSCWTSSPERKWSAGQIVEVPEELGNKLVNNPNFVLATAKEEASDEVEIDGTNDRKTRSVGRRN